MIALLLFGCTFSPGAPFATVEAITLTAAHDPGEGRDLGEGRFLTDAGYTVTIDTFSAELGDVSLLALQGGGGGGGSFDPANPPEGYSLCHGGHCHSDGGALVDYADVEAELAGGQAAFVPIVRAPVGGVVDLHAGGVQLEVAEGPWDLPATRITKAEIDVVSVHLEGEFSSAAAIPARALTLDLRLDGRVGAGLDLTVDRDQEPSMELDVAWIVDGTFLDGLDLDALVTDGALVLDDLDDPGAAAIAARLLSTDPTVELVYPEVN